MKKLIGLLMFVSLATAGAIKIDVDQLRSPDHTKVWTPPSATATLVGKDTTDNLTNKTLDKLVLTTSQVDSTTTGANAVFPTPTSTMFNFSNASLTSVDGITAPANVFVIIFRNKTGSAVTINNETGVNTTFRIVTGTGAAISLANDASLVLSYSTTYSRWYVTGGSGSGGGGGLSAWVTSHAYLTDDIVIQSNKIYKALSGHTSGTFATDLAGGKWAEVSAATITLTGDVTGSGTDSLATTIGAGKVTNTMLAGSIDLTAKVTGTLPVGNGGTGNTTGNAATATVVDDATTNATMYPLWVTGTSGSQALKLSSTKFNFNPSTGRTFSTALTLGTFTGPSSIDAALDIFGTTNAIVHAQNVGAQSTTGGAAIIGYAIPTSASMLNGNRLSAFVGGGSTDTSGTLFNATAVESFATENWSGSGAGSKLRFQVTPNTTVTRATAMTIDQNSNVAIGSSAPNANAILDVQSTTKQSIPAPVMTTTQKNAVTPVEGGFVYDNVLHAPSYYDGTSWQTGLGTISVDTDWTAYTPTFTGFGTVSAVECFYRRIGQDLYIRCKWQNGTTTAVETRLSLPSGLTTASTTLIPTISPAGILISNSSASAFYFNALMEPSASYLTFSIRQTTESQFTKSTGSNFANNGLVAFESGPIPITGWSSNASTFSAANANYSYTNGGAITIGAITTPPTKGTIVTDRVMYQRNGQNLDALYQFDQSVAGSAGSGDYLFTLPNSLQFDSSVVFFYTGANAILGANPKAIVGYGRSTANATEGISATLVAYDATRFRVVVSDATPSAKFMSATWYALSNTVVGLGLHLQAPISGWSNVSQVTATIRQLADVAVITDVKAANTNAGGSSAATWHDRNLNTLEDPNGIVTNPASFTGTGGTNTDFTLAAGTYLIEARAPSFQADNHKIRIKNTTDTTYLIGGNGYNYSGTNNSQTDAQLTKIFTITGTKTFRVQHYVLSARATNGLGIATNTGDTEVYTFVKIQKIK